MPEGDTVWLVARRLHGALAGDVVTAWDLRVPAHATSDERGRTVVDVVARGKHLLMRLDDGMTLHTHLRMDGMWHLVPTGQRWRGGPAWQVRAVVGTQRWTALGYRLPVVDLLPTPQEADVVGHLGPDLLGADWDAQQAVANLAAQPQRPIGDALLDQRLLAGIGTLYRSEVLFLHGTHPATPVAGVPDLPRLVERARALLMANRERPEQVTTGDRRRGHEHWVFERPGRACRRCGTAIRSGTTGTPPRERNSYWCPHCQPEPPAGR